MKPIYLILNTLLLTLILNSSAQAALVSRLGGDAIYDTESDLTWIANANLAATNTFGVVNIGSRGNTWDNVNLWIEAMNSDNYLGYNDWRLPTMGPLNGTAFDLTFSNDGSTDYARNISRPGTAYGTSLANEIAYLFYNSLGNVSDYNISGVFDDGCSGSCLTNTGPFIGLTTNGRLSERYLLVGPEVPSYPSYTFYFDFNNGEIQIDPKKNKYRTFAVRSGDVAAVPVPAAVWLMGSALLGLVGFRRKK